jgi:hypothetical protein
MSSRPSLDSVSISNARASACFHDASRAEGEVGSSVVPDGIDDSPDASLSEWGDSRSITGGENAALKAGNRTVELLGFRNVRVLDSAAAFGVSSRSIPGPQSASLSPLDVFCLICLMKVRRYEWV